MSKDKQFPEPSIVGYPSEGDLSVSSKGLFIRLYPENTEFTCTLTLNYQDGDVGYPVNDSILLSPSTEHPAYVEQEIKFNAEAKVGRQVTVKAVVNLKPQDSHTSFGSTYTLVS